MRYALLLPAVFSFLVHADLRCQTRLMVQDSTLNNLRHPPGLATAPVGTLGHVRKLGTGARTMLLIPGLGFGNDIWTEFKERRKADDTMYAITLPGFCGTPPPAMPAGESTFAETPVIGSFLRGRGVSP